jgi:hypothetical protein
VTGRSLGDLRCRSDERLGAARPRRPLRGTQCVNDQALLLALQMLKRLRSAPTGRAGEIETRTRRTIVSRLVGTLQVLVEQSHGLESEIGDTLDAHPDGEIFRSFFKTNSVIRRDPAGRDRRLPPALPAPRRDRRRRRPGAGRGQVRQTETREVPVGVQQAATQRALHARALHLQLEPVGCRPVRQRPPPAAHNHRRALRTLGRAWAQIIWRMLAEPHNL